jgi:ATP-dependent helicase HrpA
MHLPIHDKKIEILSHLAAHQVVVIAGETGSGKSTQLPIFCREAYPGRRVAVTQPRRIAATSLARWVAQISGTSVGAGVGYRIRFDDKASADTPIVFMTDGIILREIHSDPLLSRYGVIIVDEAHERSVNIDFLLGYLRKILPRRPDLRVIVSSATINTELFSHAFDNAPIVEVSGRLFPVETLYMPPEELDESTVDYVDAAVNATSQLANDSQNGDILVFMPTERDIRETVDRLKGQVDGALVLPLFGRLSSADQDRIFRPANQRKIIVATNVAETSITVPGIRTVVDTGMARVHRYVPGLQTTRLPVEPISRASADQRKGRCGRVSEGMCVRLYSEEDYLVREPFASPEITRSNLASVILSMRSLGLGEVESFPFLQPPSSQSVRDGYTQLYRLGAVDDKRELTPMGRTMARLPLDPHISRMVLQARQEGVAEKVMVIAAGLSVVDPRNEPEEKRQLARDIHRKLSHEKSDFLGYLNLWESFHAHWEQLRTQNAMRKFCTQNFLSYTRMREWHDVYEQIRDACGCTASVPPPTGSAVPQEYDRIHRAICAGLIGSVAHKIEDGSYRAPQARVLWIFPGSALAKAKPDWIVCHHIVETSRVFGRTAAAIDPLWLEQVAPHLCKRSYGQPLFDENSQTVLAPASITFLGLPLIPNRRVAYGKVDPAEATRVFIREALVDQQLEPRHAFFSHNQQLREEMAVAEEKLRTRGLVIDEEAIGRFYAERIQNVSSIHELNRLIRDRGGDRFLRMSESDLCSQSMPEQLAQYPDALSIGERELKLQYAFAPGSDDDGVTVEIPANVAAYMDTRVFGWLVKPLWPDKVLHLLDGLPKDLRKKLSPLKETSRALASRLQYQPRSFSEALAGCISAAYGIAVDPALLDESKIPPHLQMRYSVTGGDGTPVAQGRGPGILARHATTGSADAQALAWSARVAAHEQRGLTAWSVGDLPESIALTDPSKGIPLYGYPALKAAGESVDLVVCPTPEDAATTHATGVRALLELAFETEIGWLDRDLRLPQSLRVFLAPWGTWERVRDVVRESVRHFAFELPPKLPRTPAGFDELRAAIAGRLRGIGPAAVAALTEASTHATACAELNRKLSARFPRSGMKAEIAQELGAYMARLVNGPLPYPMLRSYPRYLRALHTRIEKAFLDTGVYRRRMESLTRYRAELTRFRARTGQSPAMQARVDAFDEMVEEYAISLFAHDTVKTLRPVSEKRLDAMVAECTG